MPQSHSVTRTSLSGPSYSSARKGGAYRWIAANIDPYRNRKSKPWPVEDLALLFDSVAENIKQVMNATLDLLGLLKKSLIEEANEILVKLLSGADAKHSAIICCWQSWRIEHTRFCGALLAGEQKEG